MTMIEQLKLSAIVAAISLASTALGQSVLDQQLGDKTDSPKQQAEKQDAVPKPAETPKADVKHVAPEMVSPDAAKAVDDIDLVKKLTGASNEDNPEDKMKEMTERMSQSQTRLADKDPGAVTQETQKRIIQDLDVMIEYARKQQKGSGGKQNQQQQQQGQKKQMSTGQQQGPGQQRGNQAASDSYTPPAGIAPAQSNGEDMRQKGPQEWGGLPARDRDLISNGANEQYLPSYKELIDRYYQALAEIGKSRER